VDTFALQWNVHFYPQSLFCDLGRRIDTDYQWVRHMGDSFHEELRNMGTRYNISHEIAQAFHLNAGTEPQASKEGNVLAASILQRAQFRSRKASKKIAEYFTAPTVRRLLQMYSIDYVRLHLPIPIWAETILQKEKEDLQATTMK